MNKRYSIGGGGKSSYSKSFDDFNCRNFINFCHAFFEKTLAFTLAETLIVMGIIGVVAALTLPNLNSSTGDKEKVAKVKKIYSNLNDAFGRAQAVYGSFENWNDTQKWGRLTEFLKLSKDCGCSNSTNCFNSDSNVKTPRSAGSCSGILADGTSIAFNPSETTILFDNAYTNYYVYVDIDGSSKGKNSVGHDIFGYTIDSVNGILPVHLIYLNNGSMKTCECNKDIPKLTCTEWVVMYDNMDYLKIDNNGKCPNGVTVLDGVTNTTCK